MSKKKVKKVVQKKRVVKPAPKKDGRKNTLKQKKFIKLLTEDYGKTGATKTIHQLLLDAGYSEESARQQTNILTGIKATPEVKSFVSRIEKIRERVLTQMEAKDIGFESFSELRIALGDLTKTIQLLSGQPTEIIGDELTAEEKALLDKARSRNT